MNDGDKQQDELTEDPGLTEFRKRPGPVVGWLLPVGFVAIGIAVMTGYLLTEIPEDTLLRPVSGIVIILLGVHRFVVSRMPVQPRERRYGGDYPRPWEKSKGD